MALDSERHRHECEARYWLDRTGGKKGRVDEVIEKITTKRGHKKAEELREEMLRQHNMRRSRHG